MCPGLLKRRVCDTLPHKEERNEKKEFMASPVILYDGSPDRNNIHRAGICGRSGIFSDEASAEVAETPETAEAPEEDAAAEKVQEAAGDEAEAEDVTLATGENAEQTETEDAAEAELSIEDGFSDGESDGALVQESPAAELTGTVQTGFGAANTNLEKRYL